MDWEERELQKIQNRLRYKAKKEMAREYHRKYDDEDQPHLIHKFKKIKSKHIGAEHNE